MGNEAESKGAKASAGPDAGGQGDKSPGTDPQKLATQRAVGAAKRFNRSHPDEVAKFDRLTDGVTGRGIRAIMAWQRANGCSPPDGKIGPSTVAVAESKKKDQPEEKAAGSATGQEEKINIFAGEEPDSADDGPVLENPSLLENITDGAAGMEHRSDNETQETLEHGGDAVQHAAEGLHHLAGVPETPWMKAAMAPAIINLLRKGEIAEAAEQLALVFSPSEVIEAIKFAVEKVGIEISPKMAGTAAKLALGGDVVWAMGQWTYEGFKAIHEAHEQGDRDSRIRMYARAFADSFLHGEGAEGGMAGALTPQQKEAVTLGVRDGSKTAGHEGADAATIGKALIRRYGSEDDARKAIMDALCMKAGQPGIWSK